MPEPVETPRATASATTLDEYRAAKAAPAAVIPPTPEETKPVVPSEPTTKVESGSAAVPETPTQETQENKGKKDRSAEGRAAELSAQGRYDEALKILQAKDRKRDDEIADLRKKLENPQAPSKPVAEPEPKPVVATTPTGKPDLKAYMKDPVHKDLEHEEVVQKWYEDTAKWQRKADAEESATAQHQRKVNEKIAAAKAKYPDFSPTGVTLSIAAIRALVDDFDNGMDVYRHLQQNPAEVARIFALSPARQIAEVGYLSRELESEAKATPTTPEKPTLPTPISRVKPAPRSLGGNAPSEALPYKAPSTLEEHRANRRAGQAGS